MFSAPVQVLLFPTVRKGTIKARFCRTCAFVDLSEHISYNMADVTEMDEGKLSKKWVFLATPLHFKHSQLICRVVSLEYLVVLRVWSFLQHRTSSVLLPVRTGAPYGDVINLHIPAFISPRDCGRCSPECTPSLCGYLFVVTSKTTRSITVNNSKMSSRR